MNTRTIKNISIKQLFTSSSGQLAKLMILLISVLGLSCSQTTQEGSINVDFGKAISFSTWVKGRNINLLPLETSEASLIGDISNLKIENGAYYFFSSKEQLVHAFSKEGKFIGTIGTVGDGEGEYKNASSFAIARDTVSILCNYGNTVRTHHYTTKGQYINYSEITDASFYDLEKLGNQTFLSTGSNTYNDINARVVKLKNDGFENIIRLGMNKSMTLDQTNFTKHKNTLLYHDSFDNKVYKISEDSSWVSHQLDFGKYKLKESYFQEGDFYQNFDKMMRNGIATISTYLESNDNTYFGLAKQSNEENSSFQLILDKKANKQQLTKTLTNRSRAFLIEDNQVVLFVHAGDLIESIDKLSGCSNFKDVEEHVSELSTEDNPVLLKISLN